jgi:CheY-like chemotaxis protein
VNLLTNARQAMHQKDPPRTLTITTRFDAAAARVTLEVRDTGPGLGPEVAARIFEPFFTTKPPGEGTGLGLSLCQGIVESHGGAISVESEPGVGTAFRLELPVGTPTEPAAAEAPAAVRARGRRILVVDDEREVAEVLSDLLTGDDHRVDIAENGVEALARLGAASYDLILSDLRMPELDGPGLYRRLEQEGNALARRLVFVTGDMLSGDVRAFLERTNALCLSKPFELDEIRRIVETALAR